MKIKALKGFSGAFSMHEGEIREYSGDKAILQDLLSAEYVEEVKKEAPKGPVKKNEV